MNLIDFTAVIDLMALNAGDTDIGFSCSLMIASMVIILIVSRLLYIAKSSAS